MGISEDLVTVDESVQQWRSSAMVLCQVANAERHQGIRVDRRYHRLLPTDGHDGGVLQSGRLPTTRQFLNSPKTWPCDSSHLQE